MLVSGGSVTVPIDEFDYAVPFVPALYAQGRRWERAAWVWEALFQLRAKAERAISDSRESAHSDEFDDPWPVPSISDWMEQFCTPASDSETEPDKLPGRCRTDGLKGLVQLGLIEYQLSLDALTADCLVLITSWDPAKGELRHELEYRVDLKPPPFSHEEAERDGTRRPLTADDPLIVKQPGLRSCFDPKTGRPRWPASGAGQFHVRLLRPSLWAHALVPRRLSPCRLGDLHPERSRPPVMVLLAWLLWEAAYGRIYGTVRQARAAFLAWQEKEASGQFAGPASNWPTISPNQAQRALQSLINSDFANGLRPVAAISSPAPADTRPLDRLIALDDGLRPLRGVAIRLRWTSEEGERIASVLGAAITGGAPARTLADTISGAAPGWEHNARKGVPRAHLLARLIGLVRKAARRSSGTRTLTLDVNSHGVARGQVLATRESPAVHGRLLPLTLDLPCPVQALAAMPNPRVVLLWRKNGDSVLVEARPALLDHRLIPLPSRAIPYRPSEMLLPRVMVIADLAPVLTEATAAEPGARVLSLCLTPHANGTVDVAVVA
jgi:hypothetical protein